MSQKTRHYTLVCNVNCRLNAFVCRNVNVWNRLLVPIVNSDTVSQKNAFGVWSKIR